MYCDPGGTQLKTRLIIRAISTLNQTQLLLQWLRYRWNETIFLSNMTSFNRYVGNGTWWQWFCTHFQRENLYNEDLISDTVASSADRIDAYTLKRKFISGKYSSQFWHICGIIIVFVEEYFLNFMSQFHPQWKTFYMKTTYLFTKATFCLDSYRQVGH